MSLKSFLERNTPKKRAQKWSLPLPFRCRHAEYSVIAAVDDDASRHNERLLQVSLDAIQAARTIDLSWISKRMPLPPYYPDVWPGEHYKLLAGLVATMKPKRIIEVGTYQGLGSLSLMSHLPPDGEVITVDIVPWDQIENRALRESDFADGRLRQVLGDLSDPKFFSSFADKISRCDLLFVDAPKNVIFERTLLQHLETIKLAPNALVWFDDVRQWNMLEIWRKISRPKLDVTSFGHWTGSGLIDWNG